MPQACMDAYAECHRGPHAGVQAIYSTINALNASWGCQLIATAEEPTAEGMSEYVDPGTEIFVPTLPQPDPTPLMR